MNIQPIRSNCNNKNQQSQQSFKGTVSPKLQSEFFESLCEGVAKGNIVQKELQKYTALFNLVIKKLVAKCTDSNAFLTLKKGSIVLENSRLGKATETVVQLDKNKKLYDQLLSLTEENLAKSEESLVKKTLSAVNDLDIKHNVSVSKRNKLYNNLTGNKQPTLFERIFKRKSLTDLKEAYATRFMRENYSALDASTKERVFATKY